MNIQRSLLLSLFFLLALAGCGKEEFGGVPQSSSQNANPLTSYSANTCSTYTLIKPRVDVLYVIDNSSSSYYLGSDVKTSIANTVKSLSADFDYRVVGTPLLETASGNQDYQVMTNSADLTGLPSDSRRLSSAAGFDFFSKSPVSGVEKGLGRTVDFVNYHKNALFRSDAYLVIVLVSNGRDEEVEQDKGYGNGETALNSANYSARLSSFRSLKTSLNSIQLRLFSVTAKSVCQPGWRSSNLSYVKMANQLYADSLATDSSVADAHDLCGTAVSSIFSSINSSIQKVLIPHQYRYSPITFASNTTNIDWASVQVKKVSPNGTSVVLVKDVDWTVYPSTTNTNPVTVDLREGPNPVPGPGESKTGTQFVKFTNLVTYPDCILITSTSKVEYFRYIVLPQKPQPGLSVRINGTLINESSTNGWSNETSVVQTLNIKAPYPNAGDENPPVMRTGFMLKLNGASNYYKSGDNVQVNYVPAGI